MQNPVVEVNTTIAAKPDTVWKAMTGSKSALFMGSKVETDWEVGHKMTFSGEWQGKPFKDFGVIKSLDEGKELSFSHWSKTPERPENYHVVRYDLEPAGSKTKVTLSQFNHGPKPEVDEATAAEFKKTWTMMLDGLKQAVEGAN